MTAQIVFLKISTGQKFNLCVFIFMYGYRSDRGCLTEGELKLYFCSWHIMVVSLGGQACTLCSQLIILGFASQTCRCSLGSTERAITVTWQERHHTKFCCKQIKKLPFSYAISDMDPTMLVHFPILCCTTSELLTQHNKCWEKDCKLFGNFFLQSVISMKNVENVEKSQHRHIFQLLIVLH